MQRVTVEGAEGGECAERRLSIRFDSFIETLSSLPDPDEKQVEEKLPGADLLAALAGQTDSFGAAVADVGEDAPLAERILALTDEAFDAAVDILAAAHEAEGTVGDPELKAMLPCLDDGTLFFVLH